MKVFSALSPHMYPAEVAAWQRFLRDKGFYRGGITGAFDDQTQDATARYQKRARIKVTGELDSATIEHARFEGFVQPTDRPDRDHFTTLSTVRLSPSVHNALSRLAYIYYLWTGKDLVVTSGMRTAEEQAQAMYDNLHYNRNSGTRYANGPAYDEIVSAYIAQRRSHASERDTVATMTRVIEAQMSRGTYVSRHLTAGAIDIRSRDMSREDLHALERAAEDAGVERFRETDHYHLQF